jgi:ribose transport system permease protein
MSVEPRVDRPDLTKSAPEAEPQASWWKRAPRQLRLGRYNTAWTSLVLFLITVVFTVLRPNQFATSFNLWNVAADAAILSILAVGMTYVIITAGIDLSVGSVLVFAGIVGAKVMVALGGATAGWGAVALGTLAALGAGLGWGVVNGLLITKLRVPALIATLGTLGMAIGLAQVLTNGSDITNIPAHLSTTIGYGRLGELPGLSAIPFVRDIPWLVVIAAAVAALFGVILATTRFGRHTYAIGSNAQAARRVGINVDRHLVKVYALSGLLSGAAGMLSLARFSTTTIASHTTDNLSAIAGAVIGGTSLFGGVGTIGGTVVGVLIPGVLQNGLIILGVQRFWLSVAVGAVLIVAVVIDQLRRRDREHS